MSLRSLDLPKDFQTCLDVVRASFHYPDHSEWEFTSEESQNITEQIAALTKWWPLLRCFRYLSPRIRDMFHGYVWEEESLPVGFVACYRRGATHWEIGWLAVLPQYRRRGIASKLLQGALDLIRENGGKIAFLGMNEANQPAYNVYEKAGFVKYTTDIFLRYPNVGPLPASRTLPEGYTLSPLRHLKRRPIYELDLQIIPANIAKYQAVEPERYRLSLPDKLFSSLYDRFSGILTKDMLIQAAGKGIVAYGHYNARARPGGVNYITLRVDPTHPKVAGSLLLHLLHAVLEVAPGRDVEFTLAEWQKAEMEAAQELGCVKVDVPYIYMGCIL